MFETSSSESDGLNFDYSDNESWKDSSDNSNTSEASSIAENESSKGYSSDSERASSSEEETEDSETNYSDSFESHHSEELESTENPLESFFDQKIRHLRKSKRKELSLSQQKLQRKMRRNATTWLR